MSFAITLALIAVFCWSTVATAFKLSLQVFRPLELLVFASFFACIFLWFCSLGSSTSRWRTQSWGSSRLLLVALTGLINPCLYYFLLFGAYDRLLAQQALALNYTWPLALVMLDSLVRRRLPKPKVLICLILAFFGILISSGAYSHSLFGVDLWGVSLALSSAVIWSIYWIMQTKIPGDELVNLTISFGIATVLMIFILPLPEPRSFTELVWPAYVGVMEMALPFYCWSMAMSRVKHTVELASLVYLSPVLSTIWIAVVLREPLQLDLLIGLVLIILACFFSSKLQSQESDAHN